MKIRIKIERLTDEGEETESVSRLTDLSEDATPHLFILIDKCVGLLQKYYGKNNE